jgi:diguanylate cyclase (GGDEF)-like protein
MIKASDNDKQRLILQLESEKHRASVQASQDHLTSLPNRRMFYEIGATYIARAKRGRGDFALLYVDLDRFKVVNDTLGHHVGDLLLQTVAARLTSALRESDVVARLGGDEFAVLLPDVNGVEDVPVIAQKVIDLVSRLCTNLDGNDVQISPSIGISVFPRDGHNVETMARNADAAMYQSKRAGRGRFTFYEPSLNATNARNFDLEQQLPRAIAYDELVMYFQPKVRLEDFRIVGFEALVRWMHPEHGMIYPGEFIPMAESTGLDVPLGDWVLHECCRQISIWQASGIPVVPIAVNVSARQLHDENLPRRVKSYLESFDVSPNLLQVEITEGSLVHSIEVAARVLQDIEKLGVSIALDDFGNGYSSFGYIRTLPIHVIKIDRSFIDEIRNRPSDAVIVASIVTLAHNLNKKVVAEGVEMIEQVVHLKTVGCDEVQGYLISRPVAADATALLLADRYIVPQA